MNKAPLPVVGHKYHFFDDGKVKPSRHYVAEITELILFSEFGKVKYADMLGKEDGPDTDTTLMDIWMGEATQCDWLYAPETDYAVKASIPEYDENPIFFVRDLKGGWFSMDTVSGWESGRLDIDGSLFETYVKETWPDYYEKHKDDLL